MLIFININIYLLKQNIDYIINLNSSSFTLDQIKKLECQLDLNFL